MNSPVANALPMFEAQGWSYQSVLVMQTVAEHAGPPGTAVTAKKWASGALSLGQASCNENGYTLSGKLAFAPGVELSVSAEGMLGTAGAPASFRATGTGLDGPTKGAIYELTGWVFTNGTSSEAGQSPVQSIRGSVRAVRGSDARPEVELGGTPVGTVGLFEIVSAGSTGNS